MAPRRPKDQQQQQQPDPDPQALPGHRQQRRPDPDSYPRPRSRKGKARFTPEEQAAIKARFLEAFGTVGVIRTAARLAGIERQALYRWRLSDPEFARAWAEAEEEAADVLEAEAVRRAVQGVTRERPIVSGGQIVATERITEYSDRLLELLLRARRPERFGDRIRHEVSVRQEVDRLARELGLDPAAILAEAEVILRDAR